VIIDDKPGREPMKKIIKEIIGAKHLAGSDSFLWLRPSGDCSLWPDREASIVGDDRDDLGHWELDGEEFDQLIETGLVDCSDPALITGDSTLSPKRERRRTLDPIDVCFGLSGRNAPLVTFVKSPLAFCNLELGPQQIREIAAALLKIASDSEALGLNPGGERRSYQVGE
jgi:hypothetical protein